jgi:hypothetical protein
MISVAVTSSKIAASAGGSSVTAAVTSQPVATAVAGGIGPQGPQGVAGTALQSASDVSLSGVADGDVLRYSASRWRNYAESQLTDGGNF